MTFKKSDIQQKNKQSRFDLLLRTSGRVPPATLMHATHHSWREWNGREVGRLVEQMLQLIVPFSRVVRNGLALGDLESAMVIGVAREVVIDLRMADGHGLIETAERLAPIGEAAPPAPIAQR